MAGIGEVQEAVPVSVEANETQPLLSNASAVIHFTADQKFCPFQWMMCRRYRLPLISEKGAILMVVWNVLFATALYSLQIPVELYNKNYIWFALGCSGVAYPIIGWLSDSKVGKYKIIQLSVYLCLFSIILRNIHLYIITNSKVILYLAVGGTYAAQVCYISSIVSFVTDQLIGASGEELSFTIYWLMWGAFLPFFTTNVIYYTGLTFMSYLISLISAVSFILAYVLMENFKHLLLTKPEVSNPITLVVRVLSYARKHTCPERRSALTFWEEECP